MKLGHCSVDVPEARKRKHILLAGLLQEELGMLPCALVRYKRRSGDRKETSKALTNRALLSQNIKSYIRPAPVYTALAYLPATEET